MKTARITDIPKVNEWTGDKGTFFFYTLVLDSGEIGQIGKKTNDAFKVGDSITYEIEVTEKGNKIKEIKPFGNGFGGKPQAKDASFALAYAKDQIVSLIESNQIEFEEGKALKSVRDATLWLAKEYMTWLKEN